MKPSLLLLLVGINALLLGALVLTVFNRARQGDASPRETEPGALILSTAPALDRAAAEGSPRPRDEMVSASSLPFQQLYSADVRQFAANLRAAGCPEETVRDIVVAEVSKRYRAQEEALRPQPADHVPAGWSPATSERRLVERRRETGLLAARKAAVLREALGYDVPVELPLYATSTTEQRFLRGAQALSVESRSAVAGAHEHYWAEVQALQERTQGFWEPADIAELDHLKAERSAFIDAVLDDRQWTEFRLHTEPAVAGFQKQLAMAEVHEDEMRALLLAARERGVSDLGAALSGGPESTEFLSAVLGGQRATELSRLQREPELRRFYGDLKAMGVEGEFIPPIYDLRQELQREIQVLAAAMDPQDPAQMERLHGEISRVQDQLREALGEEIWPQAQQEGWLSFPVRLQAVRP
jgi:hypothetical protein